MPLSAQYPQGLLTLDDQHVYRVDGRPVPGNTSILKGMGIIDDTYYNLDAAIRGTEVHALTALYDERGGDFYWPDVDSRYEGYVRGWAAFVQATGAKFSLIERPVLGAGYATTLDRVAVINGRCGVLEIKTGTCPKWVGLQTAMQMEAVKYQYGTLALAPVCRWAVELKATGKYRLVPCEDRADIRESMVLVEAWHVREKYRPSLAV